LMNFFNDIKKMDSEKQNKKEDELKQGLIEEKETLKNKINTLKQQIKTFELDNTNRQIKIQKMEAKLNKKSEQIEELKDYTDELRTYLANSENKFLDKYPDFVENAKKLGFYGMNRSDLKELLKSKNQEITQLEEPKYNIQTEMKSINDSTKLVSKLKNDLIKHEKRVTGLEKSLT
ncbi:MAG: hypothetical protein KAT05_05350, partial [Spirochaetes bacterium]|nr:hypothetical protein [Spirochaetota bacterium]